MADNLIAHTLNILNSVAFKCTWIRSLHPEKFPEHIPRLFSRDDATDEQKTSVLSLLHPLACSGQLARELASERLITLTIARLFGPLHPHWMFSTTRYILLA